jgi:hypothetical protein
MSIGDLALERKALVQFRSRGFARGLPMRRIREWWPAPVGGAPGALSRLCTTPPILHDNVSE